jgi:ADP-heptose:LPS heptosyltransferase
MAEFGIEFKDAGFPDEVAIPEIADLRNWAGLIKYADAFLGCDSVGQHLAKAMETPASVVMGATYPIDMGQFDREYDPIRISFDERISRKHERIMTMTPDIEDYVVSAVNGDPIEE